MGEVKHLSGAEALEKMRKLANEKTVMFCTFAGDQMTTRPMHAQAIDDDGTWWFFSANDSDKNKHITINPHARLICTWSRLLFLPIA